MPLSVSSPQSATQAIYAGAIGSMARHLNPGGVLIVEPWLRPDQWIAGHVQVLDQEADGVRLFA